MQSINKAQDIRFCWLDVVYTYIYLEMGVAVYIYILRISAYDYYTKHHGYQ